MSDTGHIFVGGLASGLVIGLLIGVLTGGALEAMAKRTELVARGLAQYCPHDGSFAFNGECDAP